MFHLRSTFSTPAHPLTRCGAEPEKSVLGPWEFGRAKKPIWGPDPDDPNIEKIVGYDEYEAFCRTIPKMTEWEWVRSIKDHAAHGICMDCVAVAQQQEGRPSPQQSEFNDELPF